jgi:hypothetical protein
MMAGTPTNKQNEKQRPKTRSKRGADDDEAEGRLVVCAGGAGETIDYRRDD